MKIYTGLNNIHWPLFALCPGGLQLSWHCGCSALIVHNHSVRTVNCDECPRESAADRDREHRWLRPFQRGETLESTDGFCCIADSLTNADVRKLREAGLIGEETEESAIRAIEEREAIASKGAKS